MTTQTQTRFRLPTQADLAETFRDVCNTTCNNIPGVVRIVVGSPTKKVILSAMTHGDEPAGLGVFRFLMDNTHLLKDVELILAIHNLSGGAAWFRSEGREAKHKCRAL